MTRSAPSTGCPRIRTWERTLPANRIRGANSVAAVSSMGRTEVRSVRWCGGIEERPGGLTSSWLRSHTTRQAVRSSNEAVSEKPSLIWSVDWALSPGRCKP
ncbi:hypothetical protein EV356DRAFT_309900 [Viridothelium virens]|uniref:Uncharacterized protein n=1 Tax=Viridothelium virens TaxID=1048519 RepID=A0A6A6HLX8_VIRVR|nr:hypothetical protein EV356DRAFT_309900 [Viridothelium virens]